MTELERLLSQDDSCLISVASVKEALKKEAESKSNTSELKPCPFCGTEVKMRKVPLYGHPGCFDFEVKCPKCGCSVDYTHNDTVYRSEEEAITNVIKSWNERAKESEETK